MWRWDWRRRGEGGDFDWGLAKASRPFSIILLLKLTKIIRPEDEGEAIYKKHLNTLNWPSQVNQRTRKLRWDATKHLAWLWQVPYS